jgi:hypothetical protein
VPHPHLEEDVVGDPTQVAGSEGGGNDASSARSVPADEFKDAFRLHASGVAVVTAGRRMRRAGAATDAM